MAHWRVKAYICATLVLPGCTPSALSTSTTSGENPVTATSAQYTWRLPKTTFDATTIYSFSDCHYDAQKKTPVLDLDVSFTLVPHAVADPDIGPVGGTLGIPPSKLISFWVDNNVTIKTYPGTHVLQSLGSISTNQAGTIVGNVFSSAVKLAGIGLGVPTQQPIGPAVAVPAGCGEAYNMKKEIDQLKAKLLAGSLSDADQKAATARLSTLQDAITVKIVHTIDPGVTPVYFPDDLTEKISEIPLPIKETGLIAQIKPSEKQLRSAKWFDDNALKAIFSGENYPPDLHVNIYLDLPQAYPTPPNGCPVDAPAKSLCHVHVKGDALYREVTYIPVEAYRGDLKDDDKAHPKRENRLFRQTLAFGQFGTPRNLPLSADLFQTINWTIDFNDNGEMSNMVFGSKATGVAASSVLLGASTAASSVAAEIQKAGGQASTETQRLQAENAALKAQIDNITYNQQLEQLRAKGLSPR
jgi:hypothetical protein